jgi:hypothetical protein
MKQVTIMELREGKFYLMYSTFFGGDDTEDHSDKSLYYGRAKTINWEDSMLYYEGHHIQRWYGFDVKEDDHSEHIESVSWEPNDPKEEQFTIEFFELDEDERLVYIMDNV